MNPPEDQALNTLPVEELKHLAKAGDAAAVAELRARGFFDKKRRARDGYPVSHAQERLWFLDRLHERSAAYNVPSAILLKGSFDLAKFEEAIHFLIQRHEALRTTFDQRDGRVRQFVHEDIPNCVQFTDVSSMANPREHAVERIVRDAGAPFDLQKGPMIRVQVFRLCNEEHAILFNLHHIICDEWSLGALLSELRLTYGQLLREGEPDLPPLRIQYKDFAAWQNKQHDGEAGGKAREYWHEQLRGDIERLRLPYDSPRPDLQTNAGKTLTRRLPPDAMKCLLAWAKTFGTSDFIVLAALLQAFLARYTGQSDIAIGAPFSGRTHPDVESVIGFFVNTVCLRCEISSKDSFADVMQQASRHVQNAITHQDYPFDAIVDECRTERDPSRTPFFDVMLVVQPAVDEGAFRLGDAVGESLECGFEAAKFDLTFDFTPEADGLYLRLNFNTDLFAEDTIDRMVQHFVQFVESVSRNPEASVHDHAIVTAFERTQLFEQWNQTQAAYPYDESVLSLFIAQAETNPERVAVIDNEIKITYAALNKAARQIAGAILETKPDRQEPVALVMGRSVHIVAAILAVQYANGMYVPIDPEYPDERIQYMLEDSGCRVAIAEKPTIDSLCKNYPAITWIDVQNCSGRDASPQTRMPAPDDALYMIYTSGSTGRPKGCVITHRNVVRLIHNDQHPFDFGMNDVWMCAHSFCFDFSVWEMYGALLYGGCLVIAQRPDVQNVEAFRALLIAHQITVLNQTPAAFYNLVAHESTNDEARLAESLRYVIFGGDRLEPTYLSEWVKRYPLKTIPLINMYGITETTVHVTWYALQRSDVFGEAGRSPIGQPIPGTTVYVCNDVQQIQPPGVVGELLVGGDGVCREYWNKAELTRERFIENPFAPGERLYRSGDLGRWTKDGVLEHWGRNDAQVQVRGYRIELGEIEAVLLRCLAIEQCVVLATGDSSDQQRLVAFATVREPGIDHDMVLDECREVFGRYLPEYMAPRMIHLIDAFPLTSNGKIDRNALLANEPETSQVSAAPMEPRTESESYLVALWSESLRRSDVHLRSDYFVLGGHSLSATAMVARMYKERGIKLPLRSIFQHPRLEDFARLLDESQVASYEEIVPVAQAARYSLSLAQRRLWLIERMGANPLAYIIAETFTVSQSFSSAAFTQAVAAVVERHESLRTVFVENDEHAWQVVLPALDPPIERVSLGNQNLSDEQLREQIQQKADVPFDLTEGPLFRIVVFERGNQSPIVLVAMHHICSDGQSMQVLIRELNQAYAAAVKGAPASLPPLRLQYKDYAAWQHERVLSGSLASSKAYWLDRFSDDVPVLDFPTDDPRPAVQSFEGDVALFDLDVNRTRAFITFCRSHGASPFMAVVALVNLLLYRYTGQDDLVLGAPVAGRDHPDTESLVGFFVNTVAIRSLVTGADDFMALLETVRQSVSEALDHQEYPFDQLVDELNLQRDLGRSPLFDVAITLQTESSTEVGALGAEPFAFQPHISKFDLTFFFIQKKDGSLALGIEYSTDLFHRSRIERIGTHVETLLASILETPRAPLNSLPILDDDERHRVLHAFNAVASEYPRDHTVAELVERVVMQHPDHCAVTQGEQSFTYAEVNQRANQLAHHLLEDHNLQPEERVGIYLTRSPESVIVALAILKAGGVYLPLDPAYPASRIGYMLRDSECRIVITDSGNRDFLAKEFDDQALIDVHNVPEASSENPPLHGHASSLAYVIYTSGSTGEPKGTLIEQRSILRLVLNTNYIAIQFDDCIVQTGSLSFDASTFEIWGALLNGARLCMPEENSLLNIQRFHELLVTQRCTVMFITTSLFNQFVDADIDLFAGLRVLLTGGEKVSISHVNRLRERCPALDILHVYGPTENTTFSTWHRVQGLATHDIPIGKPIANSSVLILDPHGNLQPIGIAGEICTGGDGLARGYVNQPERTRDVFIPHPYDAGQRVYRSGDCGVWNPDGSVTFLGRIDNQVKIRGFRVEPGEIEARLQRCDGVDAAAVLSRKTTVGTLELIAYCSGETALDETVLRNTLSAELPEYMVPSRFVILDALPLNRNGKIDRKRLPTPVEEQATSVLLPRTDVERQLLSVWEDVLGRKAIGIHDNFFQLGGDSIRAIQIVSRLQRQGLSISIRDCFQYLTIAELAPRISAADEKSATTEIVEGPVPLTPIQRWFFENHNAQRNHFNQSMMLSVSERLDKNAIHQTVRALWRQHDALRMQFHVPRNSVEQYNRSIDLPPGFDVVTVDTGGDGEAEILAHADTVQASFDLQNSPLFHVVLYRTPAEDRLLLTAHHLVMDGLSWRIVLEDLERFYLQCKAAGEVQDEPKTSSFQAWSNAVHQAVTHPEIQHERDYWAKVSAENLPRLFPAFNPAQSNYADCLVEQVSLSVDETQRFLTETHRAFYTEPNDILLAGLSLALAKQFDADECLLALEGHGREALPTELDISHTVGWFTSMFPFCVSLADTPLIEHVVSTKEALRAVPRKGMGYGILRYCGDDQTRATLSSDPPQISFNYLGQFDATDDEGLFSISDAPTGRTISPSLNRVFAIDTVAIVTGNQLHLSAIVDKTVLDGEGVRAFLQQWCDALVAIMDECCHRQRAEKTPADLTTDQFSLSTYRAFLSQYRWAASSIEDVYPCTPMQQGLLYQAIAQPDSESYFLQTSFRLRGAIDHDAFHDAWVALVERHAILRTAFVHDDGSLPLQIVFESRAPEWAIESLVGISAQERERLLVQYRDDDRRRGFDLTYDPLMRLRVFVVDEETAYVVWSYHHLLLDGWCLRIVYDELVALYEAFRDKKEHRLPDAPRYADYIRYVQKQDVEASTRFWSRYLNGFDTVSSEIPYSRSHRSSGFRFQSHVLALSVEQTQALQSLAQENSVTLNAVVQVALALVLAQSNDTNDVVFGAIGSGRSVPVQGIEEMLGLFINAFPVRVQWDENATLADLLSQIQNEALEAESNATLSLADIQALAPLEGDLFDALMVFANYPTELASSSGDEEAGPWLLDELQTFDQTHYDYTLIVVPGEQLTLKFHTNANRFQDSDITRLQRQFEAIFQRMVDSRQAPVDHAMALPADEYQLVVHDWNATSVAVDQTKTVLDLVDETVAKHSGQIAVECEGRSLTYVELDAQANRIANLLRDRYSIQPNERVAFYLDRSEWVPAIVLGILRAGAAYVPLDPGAPAARIEHIVRDSGSRVLFVHSRDVPRFEQYDIQCVAIDQLPKGDTSRPSHSPNATDLTYVIYTSGTTGVPKGCLLEHSNLYHYLTWAMRYYFANGGGVMGLHSSLSVDMTVTSLFMPLLCRKTLHVFPKEMETPDVLAAMFHPDSPFDCVKLTPSHIAVLNELDITQTSVSLAIVGGEALPADMVRVLHRLNPAMRVVNEYGPTETTVGCIVQDVAPGADRVLIGKPIDNTRIYILDRNRKPVPIGSPGEIYIGGHGVARGYLNQLDLTAERFVESPFANDATLYRTGDLGVWLHDGSIDYLGRNDDQIAIRGHRVERQEIEHHIQNLAEITSVVVLPVESGTNAVELAAYYVADQTLSLTDVRKRLLESLPEYCIPLHWIPLDEIPLASSGKVDTKALPKPTARSGDADATQPRNEIEENVLSIIREVLGKTALGMNSHFFEQGGHSLKVMQVTARIHKQMGVKLSVRDVLDYPTPLALAELIQSRETSAYEAIPPAPEQQTYAVSYAQKRLWLIQQIGGSESRVAYNMPKALLLEGALNIDALQAALDSLLHRHESLRTSFIEADGVPQQRIHTETRAQISLVDVRNEPEPESRAKALIEADAHTAFDLGEAPLIRAQLIQVDDQRYIFSLTMNHIIGDGWSVVVLFRDLLRYYDASHNQADSLSTLHIQYKDYAQWQQNLDWQRLETYWLNELKGASESIRLPYDRPPQGEREYKGDTITVSLPAVSVEPLRNLAQSKQTTLSTVVLGLFYILLYQWTRQDDLSIGVSVANRNHPDLEGLIGFFVNILPIRARLDAQLEVEAFIEHLAGRMRDAFDHQEYPFDLLVQQLNPNRLSTRQPIVNVIYGYQNFSDIQLGGEGESQHQKDHSAPITIREFDLGFNTSKFDLTLFASENVDTLEFAFEYDTALFDAATIKTLADTFRHFCQSFSDEMKERDA